MQPAGVIAALPARGRFVSPAEDHHERQTAYCEINRRRPAGRDKRPPPMGSRRLTDTRDRGDGRSLFRGGVGVPR